MRQTVAATVDIEISTLKQSCSVGIAWRIECMQVIITGFTETGCVAISSRTYRRDAFAIIRGGPWRRQAKRSLL